MFAEPHRIIEGHELREVVRVIREDAEFEVPPVPALRAHARAGEIGRAEKGAFPVDDNTLHVVARTEDALEAVCGVRPRGVQT